MKRNHSLQQILSCFLWLILAGGGMLPCRPVQAQISDNLQMGGYLQVMPVWIGADLPRPIDRDSFLEYRLQNRLNLRWFVSSEWTLNGQMRTRFFAGDLVEEIPFYARTIDRDDGLVDLPWMVAEQDHWFLHLIPDRLYTEWANSDWSVRIG